MAFFKGRYYKHQKDGKTLCIIAGKSSSEEFLQILTNKKAFYLNSLNGCKITSGGISLATEIAKGEVTYHNLTQLRSNIMGVFSIFPMQCRHEIVSMHHTIKGGFEIDSEYYDFDNGTGYIEGDSGKSFPSRYLWLHCNDFADKCSISLSVATIPFLGFKFLGCICAIIFKGREYRLATYNGVKILSVSQNQIVLSQSVYKFIINIAGGDAFDLKAPKNGIMNHIIKESNNTSARFRLYEKEKLTFDLFSSNVSFEYNF